MIEKEINLGDFEKKLDKKSIDFIVIDSVSFSVSKDKTEVDLIYYLNLSESNEKVVFSLKREKNRWDLN